MEIKLNRMEFIKNIEKLATIAKENKIRPVLAGIKISASDKITLQATDLESTLVITMEGEIISGGEVVIQYNEMIEYIKELDDTEISIELQDNMIYLQLQGSEISFSIYDVEEFPIINIKDSEEKIVINSDTLVRMINKSKICFPVDISNLAIAGLKVIVKENELIMGSTDTYRMVMYSEDIETDKRLEMTIPMECVKNIEKYIKKHNGELKIGLNGSTGILEMGDSTFMFRLIDLAFPDIFGVDEGFNYVQKFSVNVLKMIPTLKRLKAIVKNNVEAKNSATFLFGEKELEIKAVSDKARATEKIKGIQGLEELKIGLNVDYILQFMNNANIVEVYLNNASTVVKLQEENYKYFIMPLALRD